MKLDRSKKWWMEMAEREEGLEVSLRDAARQLLDNAKAGDNAIIVRAEDFLALSAAVRSDTEVRNGS